MTAMERLLSVFGIRPETYVRQTYHERRGERHSGLNVRALRARRAKNRAGRRSRRVSRLRGAR